MINITYTEGTERHSQFSWAEFLVSGLEFFARRNEESEPQSHKYCNFRYYDCISINQGIVFTVHEDSLQGKKAISNFWICVTDFERTELSQSLFTSLRRVRGGFRIICHAKGRKKVSMLMSAWGQSKSMTNMEKIEFARFCKFYINKRGVTRIPRF